MGNDWFETENMMFRVSDVRAMKYEDTPYSRKYGMIKVYLRSAGEFHIENSDFKRLKKVIKKGGRNGNEEKEKSSSEEESNC